eukprot:CAMPEP_0172876102 /NCGR_PEP_ID=MMETSP1075-20121228/103335_1 /TAXON_ID=2916 /ORGANISM="Ceratium fusus, Strain PA161109" /LENGTH=67 /DNA_ID=CAMNT_0013727307 /DNA_START=81 /DNA_END=281 /DNA_ORIENTATION=-
MDVCELNLGEPMDVRDANEGNGYKAPSRGLTLGASTAAAKEVNDAVKAVGFAVRVVVVAAAAAAAAA